jgi:hypothetical protein
LRKERGGSEQKRGKSAHGELSFIVSQAPRGQTEDVTEAYRKCGASLVPREHGAWAMLLQPFLGTLIVLHKLAWPLSALAVVVLVFLVRDPLTVLARQGVGVARPAAGERLAIRYLAVELVLLAVAGAVLALVWPLWILALLWGARLVRSLSWLTVRNRQRAVWLQAMSAAGLSSSALAACLAVSGSVPAWGWWMWGYMPRTS